MSIAEHIVRNGAVTSNAARNRQASYRARMAEQGLVQVTGWVHSHQAGDVTNLLRVLKENDHLTTGPLRNPETGRLVSAEHSSDE